ncbi:MAG: aminopeptidase P family protein [Phycisphaerae bacterium]|nr:aminopeptidase P family protein [Phycisphaerae bacterium]
MARRKTKRAIPNHLAARLERCRARMADGRLSAYVVSAPTDQFYLAGFTGEDGVVVVTARRLYLVTDGRFTIQAAREAPWAKAIIRKAGIGAELSRLQLRHRWCRVGFQAEHATVKQAAIWRKAVSPARLTQSKPITAELRNRKDPAEVVAIRRAIDVAEAAFKVTCRTVKIGMTERQVAARLEFEMQKRGASGPSFPTIVAVGSNAALPHARPGSRRIASGSAILIDWGATVDGYRSDLTRVVFVRTIRPQFRRMYIMVHEAQRRAIAAVSSGVEARMVDRAARSYLASVGYGKAFTHSTGHGLGLDVHEGPSLARRGSATLEAGMVVTVEPGVYVPGVGGVRIEDDILVTGSGCEVLSTLSTNLDDMVIRG